jgi:hypothetical protein
VNTAVPAYIACAATFIYVSALFIGWFYLNSRGDHLGKLIENEKLNLVGDLLAGLFAPIAFAWLVAAVIIQSKELSAQREELTLTRKEMQESRAVMQIQALAAQQQTLLAMASTKANYQLALYDKRSAVYAQLEQISIDLNTEGQVNPTIFRSIRDTAQAARFVFGEDVTSWTREIWTRGYEAFRLQQRITRLSRKQNELGLTDDETNTLNQYIDEVNDLEEALYNELTPNKLDEMLTKYLTLPETIEIDSAE